MKKYFLHTFVWVIIICFTFKSNAQIGVTKFGTNALANNGASGEYNTGLGYFALGANTSGNRNTGSGANVLRFNTTGFYNTGTGAAALYQNTSGYYNTGFGAYALFTNTTGYRNTALGNEALRLNTTGFGNTASGSQSLYYNTTGNNNTANGYYSLIANTSGFLNTAIGAFSLKQNTTGYNNIAMGYFSLFQNVTGNWNTGLGSQADVSSGNLTNATAIGHAALVMGSNRVRIGNNSITSIGGQVGWTVFSDGRYKKDIKENVQGLAFINSLRPVTYTVNVKGLNEFYSKIRKSAGGNNLGDNEDQAAKAAMEQSEEVAGKIIYNGFVAQEVESAANKLNFEFSGVDKPATEDGLYGLRYDNFISPLVKAVQELSAKNEDLQNQINELKSLIAKSGNGGSITSSAAYLKQNAPNPFHSNSVISYYIPDNAGHAQIRITDVTGRTIKTFNATKGEGQINIRSGELVAGNYNYTLYINNKTVDTKQMMLVK